MTNPIKSPYGTWTSSLTPRWMSSGTNLVDPQWSGDTLVWLEQLNDRSAIVTWGANRGMRDLTYEQPIRGGLFYGGGEFGCSKDWVVFIEKSGSIYMQSIAGGIPVHLVSQNGKSASPVLSPDQSQMLIINTVDDQDSLRLISLDQPQADSVILANQADFYMQPVWHPGGRRLAWIEWDHPQMPWQGSRLMVADFSSQPVKLENMNQIAGDSATAVFQPMFSPDGQWLSYIQNRENWDELVLIHLETGEKRTILNNMNLMVSAWLQGMRTYSWMPDSTGLVVSTLEKGFSHLIRVTLDSMHEEIDLQPYTYLAQPSVSAVDGKIAALVSSPNAPTRLAVINGSEIQVIKTSMPDTVNSGELPAAQPVEWDTPSGKVFGIYYPPSNHRYSTEGLPPAIVHIHSGPTLQVHANFSADTAFFTSKGFAFLSVNYRGSTGYGRAYRDALNGRWGEVDVDDALSAVQFLSEQKLADPSQIILKGSSAGGYTVLNCLIHHPGMFKAAICAYGVSNLFTVVEETIKFESHYYDSLIGTLPENEGKFIDWSPIFHAEKIRDPLLLFHGSDDPVVPVAQTEEIVKKLCEQNTPFEYHRFEGEGHGWRKTETLESYYQKIEDFLKKYVLSK